MHLLFELSHERLVQAVAKVLHRGVALPHNHGRAVVGHHAARLGVAVCRKVKN